MGDLYGWYDTDDGSTIIPSDWQQAGYTGSLGDATPLVITVDPSDVDTTTNTIAVPNYTLASGVTVHLYGPAPCPGVPSVNPPDPDHFPAPLQGYNGYSNGVYGLLTSGKNHIQIGSGASAAPGDNVVPLTTQGTGAFIMILDIYNAEGGASGLLDKSNLGNHLSGNNRGGGYSAGLITYDPSATGEYGCGDGSLFFQGTCMQGGAYGSNGIPSLPASCTFMTVGFVWNTTAYTEAQMGASFPEANRETSMMSYGAGLDVGKIFPGANHRTYSTSDGSWRMDQGATGRESTPGTSYPGAFFARLSSSGIGDDILNTYSPTSIGSYDVASAIPRPMIMGGVVFDSVAQEKYVYNFGSGISSEVGASAYTTPIASTGTFVQWSDYLRGYFYETIIYGGADEDTRQKIEGYLAWKHGLESSLDPSHPYKSDPPRTR